MCGRFVQSLTAEELKQRFSAFEFAETIPPPSWNIAPTAQIVILLEDHKNPGVFRAESARWSLTPSWSKTLQTAFPTFNARVEGLAEKPVWRAPLDNRRCVILTTGFYEWTGPKGARVPHFLRHQSDDLLPMAGLYGWWKEPGAQGSDRWHLTATMLTRSATGPLEHLHHRAPVFMHPQLQDTWIDAQEQGTQRLVDAVAEASTAIADRLRIHEVAPLRGDGPELIRPVSGSAGIVEP